MQFRLTFRTGRLTIPFSCQYQMQSMVYSLLGRDQAYGATVHPAPGRAENRAYTTLCFGQLTGRKEVDRAHKQLNFTGRVNWEMRTADPQLAEVFCRLLAPGLILTLCGQPLMLEAMQMTQREIAAERCRIRMLSPILAYERAEDKKAVHYNPLCDAFAPLVIGNFRRKYQALTGVCPEEIRLEALAVGSRDKVVTNYKGTWLTGWTGEYLLVGKPEYLTFLYDAGLGLRNAAGFGLFETAEEG